MAEFTINPGLMAPNLGALADPRLVLAQKKDKPLAGFLGGVSGGLNQGVQLGKLYAQRQEQAGMQAAVAAATDPATGQIDRQRLAQALYKVNPSVGLEADAKISGLEERNQLLAMRKQVADLEMQTGNFGIASRLTGAVRANPGLWGNVKGKLETLLGTQLPDSPTPELLDGIERMGLDSSQRLQAARDEFSRWSEQTRLGMTAQQLEEQRRRNAATEDISRQELGIRREGVAVQRENAASLIGYRNAKLNPPAGKVIGEHKTPEGDVIQTVSNGDGTTKQVQIPRDKYYSPNANPLAGLVASPSGATPTPAAPAPTTADIVRRGRDANGRALAQLKDGRVIYLDDGSPVQ